MNNVIKSTLLGIGISAFGLSVSIILATVICAIQTTCTF